MCEDIKGVGPRNQLIFPLFQKQFGSECLKHPQVFPESWKERSISGHHGTIHFTPSLFQCPSSCVTGNWVEIKGFYEAVFQAYWFVCFISGRKSWAGKFVSTLLVLVWVLLLFACLLVFLLADAQALYLNVTVFLSKLSFEGKGVWFWTGHFSVTWVVWDIKQLKVLSGPHPPNIWL